MSRQEQHSEHGQNKWDWARRRGLIIGAAGALVAGAGAVMYSRWHRGAPGLAAYERRSLEAAGAAFYGDYTGDSGIKPATVDLTEFIPAAPPEGTAIVIAAGKKTLSDQVSRSGGQLAIAYREGEEDWRMIVENPQRPFANMSRSVLGFEEVAAALHLHADSLVTEAALGSAEDGVTFSPVNSYAKDNGERWSIAERYPHVPIFHTLIPPGSGS